MTSMPFTLRTMFFGSIGLPLPIDKAASQRCRLAAREGRCPSRSAGGVGEGAVNTGGNTASPKIAKASALAICRGTRCQLLLGGVLGSRALDQGFDDLFISLQPIRGELPGLAIPGVDTGPRSTHVVHTGGADGADRKSTR